MRLWKKVLSAVTAGALCVGGVGLPGVQNVLESVGTVLSASAEDKIYGDLSYDVTDAGEVVITGYNGDAATVEIPSEIDGKPVTSIGWSAFQNCTSLTTITIPGSVKSVGWSAFKDCTGLTGITISNGVTIIEGSAFEGCTSLTAIAIPDSVMDIKYNAFKYCTGLKEISISNGVTILDMSIFEGCTSTP